MTRSACAPLPASVLMLPLLAAGRAAWEFFSERLELERWQVDSSATVVELEVVPDKPAKPAAPAAP